MRTILLLLLAAFLGASNKVGATVIPAHLYEIRVSGTFGGAVTGGPLSSYPFPEIRGGSFEGTFIYDEFASASQYRFPYHSLSLNILDETGQIANTIVTAPNGLFVQNDFIQITFGRSYQVYDAIEDLRLTFSGSFANLHQTPSPVELTSATFSEGYLETDQIPNHSWTLGVTSATLTHTRTIPYLRFVPDGANTLVLLSLALGLLLGLRPRPAKSEAGPA
jgi:hypothetical protein